MFVRSLAPLSGLLAAPLLLLIAGCVVLGDASPYALLITAPLADDDDSAVDDDDSADDDDAVSTCENALALVELEDAVSLADDIAPIFLSNCPMCHVAGQEFGGLSLDPANLHGGLVGQPALGFPSLNRIEPVDPERSYLFHKVLNCEGDDPIWGYSATSMPPPGQGSYFDGDELNLLYTWILQGAEDN